jgi:hypothetical protein
MEQENTPAAGMRGRLITVDAEVNTNAGAVQRETRNRRVGMPDVFFSELTSSEPKQALPVSGEEVQFRTDVDCSEACPVVNSTLYRQAGRCVYLSRSQKCPVR